MKNTKLQILTAEAIVRVFETGRAAGDPAAVAVLNDGAGVSYGISQFTHRSGSLGRVVRLYLELGGAVGADALRARLPLLARRSPAAIADLSADAEFRATLQAAGATRTMRLAQERVARAHYLLPAVRFCLRHGFVHPLSLAVVLDSLTQGSFDRIRADVTIRPGRDTEKAWVTEYVRRRHVWLGLIPRLRPTRYRTLFFLGLIMTGRWELELPIVVRGVRITEETLDIAAAMPARECSDARPEAPSLPAPSPAERPADFPSGDPATATPAGALEQMETRVGRVADRFDRVERATRAVIERTDRAKSLWTTVSSAAWQALWAAVSLLAGVPREVWFVVAAVTAVTVLFYLYRQIALGKIRELKQQEAR